MGGVSCMGLGFGFDNLLECFTNVAIQDLTLVPLVGPIGLRMLQ